MRLRSISVLLAVVMTAVCFAGCNENKDSGAGSADSDMVTNAAISYGMQEKEFNAVMSLMVDYDNIGTGYYVSKNATDAQGVYMQLTDKRSDLAASVTAVSVAAANETLGPGNFSTFAYQFTFADSDSARQLYDTIAIYYSGLSCDVASGEKDGFTYTLSYFEGSVVINREGVYLKDNTLIYIYSDTTIESSGSGFASVVFEKVGVADPAVLHHASS